MKKQDAELYKIFIKFVCQCLLQNYSWCRDHWDFAFGSILLWLDSPKIRVLLRLILSKIVRKCYSYPESKYLAGISEVKQPSASHTQRRVGLDDSCGLPVPAQCPICLHSQLLTPCSCQKHWLPTLSSAMSKAKYSNKYDSFPLKSWRKEKWSIGIRDWSAVSPREKKLIQDFIARHPLKGVALLLCCPHVVHCLCLLEASAQEHRRLQMTGAPSTALGLKYLTRTLLCWLYAALAVWSGWTCELVPKAEEVFRSTKGHLSTHLSATPLKTSLT